MKRIAIGAPAFDPLDAGGLNRYTGEMLRALMARDGEKVVFTTSPEVREQYGDSTRLVAPHVLSRSNFAGNALRLAWHQMYLPRALRREGVAAFFSPVPEGMLSAPCPQVITVHDVLPLRFPEVYPRLQHYFRYIVPRLLRASAAVIVDSEATRQDVQEFYGVRELPLHVVYPGYDARVFRRSEPESVEAVRNRYGLGDYVLAVGETRPYKNMRRLIEAFARARLSGLQLAIVGKASRMDREVANLPRKLRVESRVCFLGYVPDEDLASLYSGAVAFVYPSLYEGFGIPPLEAMACGCPVIASNVASIPEVCGDAALYVDPYDVESIGGAVRHLADDTSLRDTLRRKGLARVQRFGYTEAADRVARILSDCVV